MSNSKDIILKTLNAYITDDKLPTKEEVKTLLVDYKKKLKRIDRIINQSDKQQLLVMELNAELDEHKNNLELKVLQEIQKRRAKEKMLLQQSKLASMGEMMDAVAHQWKQPLNVISAQVINLTFSSQLGTLDEATVEEFEKEITNQINHMTDTLNEFRSFFRPSKNIEEFDIKKTISKVLLLVKDEFAKHAIEIIVNSEQSFKLSGIENEFKHLIINIINNAKDAFIENDIKDRKITINCIDQDDIKALEIIDNAGGIPKHVINDIFKANVTTKEEGKGTGIGLYMSSQIAEKHQGVLSVQNTNDGAKFIFKQTI